MATTPADGSLTGLLGQVQAGSDAAREALWRLVFDELRGLAAGLMARERPGHPLQPTALVNEAYMRLAGGERVGRADRAYFFAAAAQAMRRILIEHARRASARNEAASHHLPAGMIVDSSHEHDQQLDALEACLDDLERTHPVTWSVVMHRYFGGLSVETTAECLNMSPRSVSRHWSFGRSWLFDAMTRRLRDDAHGTPPGRGAR